MSSTMQITAILLKNYRQFRSFKLDLTDPVTKQPLDKVCFIGSNGTGKSTLLELLSGFLYNKHSKHFDGMGASLIASRVSLGMDEYFVIKHIGQRGQIFNILPSNAKNTAEWAKLWDPDIEFRNDPALKKFLDTLTREEQKEILQKIMLKPNSHDLAIYAPPEGSSLLKKRNLPQTSLSDALALFNDLPAFHTSSYDNLEDFWKFLTYQIKKRERDYLQFLETPETQAMAVAMARQKFDQKTPNILAQLAEQWDLILAQAGLEFDIDNAKVPVQVNETLQAYIRLKSSQETIPYNALSTGIRNFIFRFGHIFTLYFNRHIQRGFLLLDEPEASLFPDLLYDIIERYLAVIHNTQFFVATHSPIIAAQFRPEERFVLEFDEAGYVTWKRGVSPEGDDPNDLLMNDFVVRSLYGKKGVEQWHRFLELRRQISATTDPKQKMALLTEYTKIGNAYNFAPHEISE